MSSGVETVNLRARENLLQLIMELSILIHSRNVAVSKVHIVTSPSAIGHELPLFLDFTRAREIATQGISLWLPFVKGIFMAKFSHTEDSKCNKIY